MNWVWDRFDRLLAAVVIAVCAATAAQIEPLIQQYLTRAGAALAAAEAHLSDVRTGLKYQVMAETVRRELETAAQAEAGRLRAAYDPIAGAGFIMRPVRLLNNSDTKMRDAAVEQFVPAIPRNRDAIGYTIVGVLVGAIGYELLRWVVTTVFIEQRKRRFRRR